MVKQGDIIWLDHDTKVGHENRQRWPALVLSNEDFNRASTLAIVCPISSEKSNNKFCVKIDKRTKTQGYILTDQAKELDIYTHNYEFIERLPHEILFQVIDIVEKFIDHPHPEPIFKLL